MRALPAPETCRSCDHGQEGVLHGFFGILAVAGNADGQPIHAIAEHGGLGSAGVSSTQGFEKFRVTLDNRAVDCHLHQCNVFAFHDLTAGPAICQASSLPASPLPRMRISNRSSWDLASSAIVL
jgi:hypothetical protein